MINTIRKIVPIAVIVVAVLLMVAIVSVLKKESNDSREQDLAQQSIAGSELPHFDEDEEYNTPEPTVEPATPPTDEIPEEPPIKDFGELIDIPDEWPQSWKDFCTEDNLIAALKEWTPNAVPLEITEAVLKRFDDGAYVMTIRLKNIDGAATVYFSQDEPILEGIICSKGSDYPILYSEDDLTDIATDSFYNNISQELYAGCFFYVKVDSGRCTFTGYDYDITYVTDLQGNPIER